MARPPTTTGASALQVADAAPTAEPAAAPARPALTARPAHDSSPPPMGEEKRVKGEGEGGGRVCVRVCACAVPGGAASGAEKKRVREGERASERARGSPGRPLAPLPALTPRFSAPPLARAPSRRLGSTHTHTHTLHLACPLARRGTLPPPSPGHTRRHPAPCSLARGGRDSPIGLRAPPPPHAWRRPRCVPRVRPQCFGWGRERASVGGRAGVQLRAGGAGASARGFGGCAGGAPPSSPGSALGARTPPSHLSPSLGRALTPAHPLPFPPFPPGVPCGAGGPGAGGGGGGHRYAGGEGPGVGKSEREGARAASCAGGAGGRGERALPQTGRPPLTRPARPRGVGCRGWALLWAASIEWSARAWGWGVSAYTHAFPLASLFSCPLPRRRIRGPLARAGGLGTRAPAPLPAAGELSGSYA